MIQKMRDIFQRAIAQKNSIYGKEKAQSIRILLSSVAPWQTILNELDKTANQKQVCFYRHAQSTLNQWKTKSILNFFNKQPPIQLRDPELTPLGLQQCKKAMQYQAQLFFVSPFRRTLKTFQVMISSNRIQTQKSIITPLAMERSKLLPGVIGSIQQGPFITKLRWWRNDFIDHDFKDYTIQNTADFKARMFMLSLWILLRPQKRIGLISHACIYDQLFKNRFLSIQNCQKQILPGAQVLNIVSEWQQYCKGSL